MSKAYDWAFLNPLRKIFYNLTTTSLSVVVALVIGSVELAQVLIHLLHLQGPGFDWVAALDFGVLGYVIVGLFLLAWALSVATWKFGRIEARYGQRIGDHRHLHVHGGGPLHSHEHVHEKARALMHAEAHERADEQAHARANEQAHEQAHGFAHAKAQRLALGPVRRHMKEARHAAR